MPLQDFSKSPITGDIVMHLTIEVRLVKRKRLSWKKEALLVTTLEKTKHSGWMIEHPLVLSLNVEKEHSWILGCVG